MSKILKSRIEIKILSLISFRFQKKIHNNHIMYILSVAWLFGVQLVVFFCSGISVLLLDTPGISRCHNTLCLSSPHF